MRTIQISDPVWKEIAKRGSLEKPKTMSCVAYLRFVPTRLPWVKYFRL
jgi:hypothetical protein